MVSGVAAFLLEVSGADVVWWSGNGVLSEVTNSDFYARGLIYVMECALFSLAYFC